MTPSEDEDTTINTTKAEQIWRPLDEDSAINTEKPAQTWLSMADDSLKKARIPTERLWQMRPRKVV